MSIHGPGRLLPRLLMVSNDFPPRPGGIEQFLANLLAHLDPSKVRVLASRWDGDAEYDARLAYPVERVGRRPLLPTAGLLRRIERAASEHEAEVVMFGASWPLAELADRIDLPTFAFTYGWEAGLAQFGLGPLMRRVAQGTDAVGFISEFTRHALDPWMGAHTTMAELPPGVDLDLFHPGVDGLQVRSRLGLGEDQLLVVCLSRVVRRKGQDALIEAWPAVRAQVPGAHLAVAGAGPFADRLRARVATLGLERSVTFTGELPWAEVPAHYAAADLFAMPCRTRLGGLDVEGLGIVYLEAQACGTPVLAGRSGGAPEALVDGETGVVVDGRSVPAVAAGLVDLLRDPDRLVSMGKAGRALVERRHGWAMVARRLEEILGGVVLEPDGVGGHA